MSEFLKPQSPLQHKDGAYIYPLTTADQVILEDNNRLNFALEHLVYSDEEHQESAVAPLNADTLGGHPVEDFLRPKAGFIYPLAGSVIPEGFLLCDGAAHKRTEFPELFAAIGTIYGSGDGSTTFNVPNLQTRVPVGAGGEFSLGATGGEAEHTLTVEEMPSHNHSSEDNNTTGNIGYQESSDHGYAGFAMPWTYVSARTDLGIHVAPNGGSQPHNNMQPYTVVNYIIATGKDTGVSVSDIVMGAQAIPLGVEYGGTGATNVADVRKKFGIGVRNLLDNSDFTNPVNQRGLNSYSGLFANCIDRWLIYQISGQAKIHVEDGYIRLVPGRSLPCWSLMQDFPVGTFTAGAYTLAYCDVDGNITINNNPICEDNDLNSGEVVQRVELYGTEETCLKWAALYEGEYTVETLPEYQPKSYAEEIVACNLGETGNVTGTELLWENASPTSAFAAQTLSIDFSNFEKCAIEYNGYLPDPNFKIDLVPVGKEVWLHTEFNTRNVRSVTIKSDGVIFEEGMRGMRNADATQDNNSCVPIKIYGIKGVQV